MLPVLVCGRSRGGGGGLRQEAEAKDWTVCPLCVAEAEGGGGLRQEAEAKRREERRRRREGRRRRRRKKEKKKENEGLRVLVLSRTALSREGIGVLGRV